MRASQVSSSGIVSTCSILPGKTRVGTAEFTRRAGIFGQNVPLREGLAIAEYSFPGEVKLVLIKWDLEVIGPGSDGG